MLHVLSDAHLFFVYHYESVKNDSQRNAGYRVKVNCFLFDLNIVALSMLLKYLLLVFSNVFLTNRNYRSVPELLYWSQIYANLSKIKKLTWEELIWMDSFYSSWNVKVDTEHGASPLHCLLIGYVVVWYWNTELKHSQLDITCSADVTVHVNFVVKRLLMLYHETLVRSVLIAF